MVKSTLYAAIGFVAISSTALAEDLSSATAPLPPRTFTTSAHSDDWKIANALSAGPAAITERATVIDGMPNGKVLRQGTNGWTCMPDVPRRPDERGRDHNEVVYGELGWEEAGHRSGWTVLPIC